jgi:hypothetical protein
MNSNIDMTQLELLIDLVLGDCWRREMTLFFEVTPKTSFETLFSELF